LVYSHYNECKVKNNKLKVMHVILITHIGRGDILVWFEKWLLNSRLCDRMPLVEHQDSHLHINDI